MMDTPRRAAATERDHMSKALKSAVRAMTKIQKAAEHSLSITKQACDKLERTLKKSSQRIEVLSIKVITDLPQMDCSS